jgi:hypothetical protein
MMMRGSPIIFALLWAAYWCGGFRSFDTVPFWLLWPNCVFPFWWIFWFLIAFPLCSKFTMHYARIWSRIISDKPLGWGRTEREREGERERETIVEDNSNERYLYKSMSSRLSYVNSREGKRPRGGALSRMSLSCVSLSASTNSVCACSEGIVR